MRFLVVLLFSLAFSSQAQPAKFYKISFTDKNNSPYALSAPHIWLSQAALDRRAAQNIPIDSLDLPVNPAYLDSVAATGVDLWGSSRWFNYVIVRTADSLKIAQIQALPFVAVSEPVSRKQVPATVDPAVFKRMECLLRGPSDYGPSFNQVNMIAADYLHNLGYRGDSMVIAVLDAGFFKVNELAAFDSLRLRNGILSTWDFVENHASVYEDHTHGMFVLSTMAGNLPDQLIGTAPGANYHLLRTEKASTETISEEYFWVLGAEYADSAGADIINSSLGYTTFDSTIWDHTYADMNGDVTIITRAADIAASRGILVVNSAGNEGTSGWHFIGAPADGDSVLTVGGVDASSAYAPFSSKGPASDGAIKPDVAAQGSQTVLAGDNGGIILGNGTSFSAPLISGAAACLWGATPNSSAMEILEAIRKSGHQAENPDSLLGYGIPDMAYALYILGIDKLPDLSDDHAGLPYPNPSIYGFKVDLILSRPQPVNFSLYDLSGRLVKEDVFEFRAAGTCTYAPAWSTRMAQGVYLLNISMSGRSWTRKVVLTGQ